MKLHIANKNYSSWSLRPWLTMKLCGFQFEEIIHPFPADSAWDLYRQFSPSGKVPCLEDGKAVVWDSLAIIEYLAEQKPQVWPTDKTARTWARCAAAEMHSGFQTLRNICGMNCGIRIELNTISTALQKDINRINELWEQGIKQFGGPFLGGGTFTAVDAFFAPVVFRAQTYHLSMSETSKKYMHTILQLPAMKEWYQSALEEIWRDPMHEQEALDAGKLIADYRRK
jgi:glutathione S-transferase